MTTTTDDLMVRELAEHAGVCSRPLVRKLVDLDTGDTRHVPIACGSTREKVCPPCAAKARALRQQQCREGWHRDDEPDRGDPAEDDSDDGVRVPDLTGLDLASARQRTSLEVVVTGHRYLAFVEPGTVLEQSPNPGEHLTASSEVGVVLTSDNEGDTDEGIDQPARRRRSTKRREDVGELPKRPTENRTLGRTFTSLDGKTYRPSMFLTFTLPSYGRVRSDGTPYDPDSYDYRRAALDAIHFPGLVDRLIQNLRRGADYKVQYFATVEPQKRLALHLHAAVRGTIPRETVRQVVNGAYHQVWWPHFDEPVYTDTLPVWNESAGGYLNPDTGELLPTFDQVVDTIDKDHDEPAHMIRPGKQFDYQGIIAANEQDVSRSVGYLTKYLTKSVAETYDPHTITKRQTAHRARLHAELRWLPCSPKCTNWLRYGVQPKGAEDGMVPGECGKPAHELDNLGHGGRRVLVSRQWTGKRLAEHKADRAAIVRATLEEAGIDMPEADRYAADATNEHGDPLYQWEDVPLDRNDNAPDDRMPSYRELIRASVAERNRWRQQYDAARELLTARDGPPDDTRSANQSAAMAALSGGTR